MFSGLLKPQVGVRTTAFRGTVLFPVRSRPVGAVRLQTCVVKAVTLDGERLRLDNLSPQEGSRRKSKRKGRGYGAGQGGTCGFGMRGQKARSGSGVRPGFEGGQTSLYRRLPKLKGIAGGMGAGLPKFATINLGVLGMHYHAGEEVTLESLRQKRLLNVSGREAKLPLKVLGNGDLIAPLTIKAAQFSSSAREKIDKAGGQLVELPQKPKWTRALHKRRVQEQAAAAAAEAEAKRAARKERAAKRSAAKAEAKK